MTPLDAIRLIRRSKYTNAGEPLITASDMCAASSPPLRYWVNGDMRVDVAGDLTPHDALLWLEAREWGLEQRVIDQERVVAELERRVSV